MVWLTANRCSWSNDVSSEQVFGQEDAMSVAWELEFEACRPRLYALPDQPARSAPSPRVHRRRVVAGVALGALVVTLLVLLALPVRSFGGSTLAQAAPAQGQQYIVKPGDTLATIAAQADPTHTAALAARLAHEVGSPAVVPGEHIYIP
jgi:ferric-dicitrate binding protein FerR (iron transport regulator)